MKRTLYRLGWVGFFLLVNGGMPSCQPLHDSVFSTDRMLTARAEQLKTTNVTPHLAAPIAPGGNVLWCGTFQLAWNEACKLIGEDLHFVDESPMVGQLNRKAFTRDGIDEGSHVSLAGFVRDDIHGQIERALQEKFKGQAAPKHLPDKQLTPRPQDIVAYSCLFKHMEFPRHFERLDEPLRFGGVELASFGMRQYKPAHNKLYRQVLILDYKGPDDFVVELKTKAGQDRLILAKVPPAATLGETIDAVQRRTTPAEAVTMRTGDVLVVPKLNFDLTRRLRELERPLLPVKNPEVAGDLILLSAIQNIRFQMDEKGVRLRSESSISFGCGAAAPPTPQHIMVFDKPFLILMQRADAKIPYFALWAGNTELLLPPK